MPKLRPAFRSPGKPDLWFCSLCGSNGETFQTLFTIDRERVQDLNRQFEKHCQQHHPGGHTHGMGRRTPRKLSASSTECGNS
jgi:hypothetical protein